MRRAEWGGSLNGGVEGIGDGLLFAREAPRGALVRP